MSGIQGKVLAVVFADGRKLGDVIGAIVRGVLAARYRPALADYQCSCCGARGVKLWRTAATFRPSLACEKCMTGRSGAFDANGFAPSRLGMTDQYWDGDAGPCYVPAIPDSAGDFWGYASFPPAGIAWWQVLPTR